jgi:hypothetical protein
MAMVRWVSDEILGKLVEVIFETHFWSDFIDYFLSGARLQFFLKFIYFLGIFSFVNLIILGFFL